MQIRCSFEQGRSFGRCSWRKLLRYGASVVVRPLRCLTRFRDLPHQDRLAFKVPVRIGDVGVAEIRAEHDHVPGNGFPVGTTCHTVPAMPIRPLENASLDCFLRRAALISCLSPLFAATVPQLPEAAGRSHSWSFDQRRRPETFRTAIATAFFWPTRTTSLLPRVTPV
jgi:hypothetical protein